MREPELRCQRCDQWIYVDDTADPYGEMCELCYWATLRIDVQEDGPSPIIADPAPGER